MTSFGIASSAVSLILAASLAACSKPPAPEAAKPAVDTARIAEAVKADARALVADYNAHDAAKAVAHDAPEYVGMFHGAPNVVGPDADLAATKQQLADSPNAKVTVLNEAVDVAASGDMAVYRASYAYDFTDPKTKRPGVENGNWLVGYKSQPDGSWKIAWSVVSDTPPVATPAPAAK